MAPLPPGAVNASIITPVETIILLDNGWKVLRVSKSGIIYIQVGLMRSVQQADKEIQYRSSVDLSIPL